MRLPFSQLLAAIARDERKATNEYLILTGNKKSQLGLLTE